MKGNEAQKVKGVIIFSFGKTLKTFNIYTLWYNNVVFLILNLFYLYLKGFYYNLLLLFIIILQRLYYDYYITKRLIYIMRSSTFTTKDNQ